MTPDEQTLCREIAGLEYPENDIRPMPSGYVAIYPTTDSPPGAPMKVIGYLTDPDERWRMLKAVLEDGWLVHKTKVFCLFKSDWLGSSEEEHHCENEHLPRAIAEAYLEVLRELSSNNETTPSNCKPLGRKGRGENEPDTEHAREGER